MATTSKPALHVSERDFLRQLKDLANLFDWRFYHTFDSRRSTAGYPDVTLVRDGHLIFSELKTNVGRVTPAQAEWLSALQQCPGVEAYVWRPGDWDTIVSRLKRGISRDNVGYRDTPAGDPS